MDKVLIILGTFLAFAGAVSSSMNPTVSSEAGAFANVSIRLPMDTTHDSDLIERTIKFQFNECRGSKSGTGPVAPFMVHVYWMNAVQDVLGENIEFIGKNTARTSIPMIDTVKWNNPNFHRQHFHIHKKIDWRDPEKGQQVTFYLVHRIRTNQTIDMIKRIPRAFQILKQHNCCIHEHYWDESVWDCTQLGFATGLDYRRYDPKQATAKFTRRILEQLPTLSPDQIPEFRLVFCTPTVRHADRRRVVSTKAYAVEVQAVDHFRMGKLLRTAFRGQRRFVLFKMRHSCLQAFENAIQYQNLKLSATAPTFELPAAMLDNNVPPGDHSDTAAAAAAAAGRPSVADADAASEAPPPDDAANTHTDGVVVDDGISSITTTSEVGRLQDELRRKQEEHNVQSERLSRMLEQSIQMNAMMKMMISAMASNVPPLDDTI